MTNPTTDIIEFLISGGNGVRILVGLSLWLVSVQVGREQGVLSGWLDWRGWWRGVTTNIRYRFLAGLGLIGFGMFFGNLYYYARKLADYPTWLIDIGPWFTLPTIGLQAVGCVLVLHPFLARWLMKPWWAWAVGAVILSAFLGALPEYFI